MTRRSGFELWGLTLARVITPFLGMGLVLHEVVIAEQPRAIALTAGLAAMGIMEAAVSAARRHMGNGNGDHGRPASGDVVGTVAPPRAVDDRGDGGRLQRTRVALDRRMRWS